MAAAPVPVAQPAAAKPNLMAMLNSTTPSQPVSQPIQPAVTAQPPPGYGAPLALGGIASNNANAHRPSPSLSQPSFGGLSGLSAPLAPQPQPSQNLFGGAAAPMKPTTLGGASQSSSAGFGSLGGGAARPGSTPAAAKPASSANFDDLWSLGLGTSTSKPATPVAGTKSIQALQKEKAAASIWGQGQSKPQAGPQSGSGSFGGASSSGGGDDLLL